ncbi:MAG: NAD(P)H-hydrate dehydratase [Syntrophothermus sp.]|uniref:NAD(P)H-hydrate dehydratase n=1 Tax=Syntrophothermus sp. TaxID=2736299 RepID=UPI00257F43D9|nr:NAD(P)H-hydrate dehydratase [Syntrophothermus sp.]NSW84187.1 NAD(P)H-hydrate dehydratase [Syntrophothermus sp.]
MKIVSAQEMRDLDRRASSEFHIPSIVLMENAGLRVVEAVQTALAGIKLPRVVVIAGKGNNGGDGFVVSRHLINSGFHVDTFLLGRPSELTPDAELNFRILQNISGRVFVVSDTGELQGLLAPLSGCDLVVDAIYGIGFHGEMPSPESEVVKMVNQSGKPVVAVDIPSGVEADTGKVRGEAIRATWTVTMALPKKAFFLEPGRSYTGMLTVGDISIPRCLLEAPDIKTNLVTEDWVAPWFLPRPAETHKGSFGHVLVVGGSVGLTGAVVMAAEAALRSGAGLVTAAVPQSLQPAIESRLIEVMTTPLPETSLKTISLEALPALQSLLERTSVCVAGPGMGRYPEARAVIRFILETAGVPVVIDADGLNALAEDLGVLKDRQIPVILTPHPGEMSGLSGLSVADIQADRLEVARGFASEWGVTLVLKGHNTVIATPGGDVYVNVTGNPGMATAGSGDVLSGIIAGFMAQGLLPDQAAISGVYVHGKAGDEAKKEKGERGLNAMDIVHYIPAVLKAFESR